MAIEVANDHIGIVIVQGIWVIKLELSSWWFVDRGYGDTANVDGEYLNVDVEYLNVILVDSPLLAWTVIVVELTPHYSRGP